MDSKESEQSEGKRTASDKEVVAFFTNHINNPCKVDLGGGIIGDIRDFYIREAKKILPTFTDQESANKLRQEIGKYDTKTP